MTERTPSLREAADDGSPPTSHSAATPMGKLDRRRRPSLGPTPPLRLPAVQRTRLANGLEVLLIPHAKAPVVHMTMVLPRGTGADPLEQAGLANLAAAMFDEGTAVRGSLELADELDFLGASIGAGAGWDTTYVWMSCLTRHLERAVELYAEVLTQPAFPESEWQRLRRQRLDGLSSALDQPTTLAAWAFDRVLYGAGHAYGWPSGGTPSSIPRLSVDGLRQFHRLACRPSGASLVVVGDVTASAVLPRLERELSSWSGEVESAETAAPAATPSGVRITLVDKPGAGQSVLRIGHVGVPRHHPDYFALRVMNTVLGGYFASRLNRNLRETRGFTYGASSGFDFRRQAGPFTATASVHTKDTAAAVGEVVRELSDIRSRRPPTPEEVASATAFMTRGFVRHFETAHQIGDNWAAVVAHRLPDDFFNTWVETVSALDAAAVGRVASEHIRSDALEVVLCGDAVAVAGSLEHLGLGPVRVLRRDEIFATAEPAVRTAAAGS